MTGFIVEAAFDHFLDKNRVRFIKHGREDTPYVHTAERLLTDVVSGATWPKATTKVYPGEFDPQGRDSHITGEGVDFKDFLTAQLQSATQAAAVTETAGQGEMESSPIGFR